ncbi:MAG: M3 family metallopeptidase [Muribaculaceae bacterium]|nr:M3 family metallopeptidase [Muribaculaceae bacterium]
MSQEHQNPFLAPYTTPYEIPPFEQIQYSDYIPALQQGIAEQKAAVEAIINNPEAPTFDNTVLAFEKSGDLLNRVMLVFSSLDESLSSPEMVEIAEVAYPAYSVHSDQMMMDDRLFQRFKTLYDNRDNLNLTGPRRRAVEEYYKSFVRAGALLDDAKKEELSKVNTRLTDLYLKFNKNLLNATNAYELVVDDPAKLAGLPASSIDQAADEAKARGHEGKWVFTLHAPSRLPLLQYADNRDLRRAMYEAYTSLASSGEYNNYPVINDILKTRAVKASLLGYPDYAAYMTANVMAKTTQAAEDLLLHIWQPAINRVADEVKEMQAVVDAEGGNFTIAPWDYYYYAEKVRRNKYNLDENEVRRYFALDNVRRGIFTMAERLYGITFTEMPDAPKYHPEVKVYDVKDAEGKHLAVFMTDYFPRESKRQGAWMSEFKGSFVDPDGTVGRPIIYNVGNFSRPTADAPALLTLDEVETMFHEFGHGLHGMLSRAALRSQSGTNVDRDFVELPSQIHEHWALEPELLKEYAFHYKTGEVIPDSLITKLQAASTHNQGFTTTELVGAALLDLQWGKLNPTEDVDVEAFERNVAGRLNMPAEVQFRYRSPYFKHIFGSDGYASGYYTYLWAEVLDSDGFELFAEKGIFDPETARSFRENILEAGGSEDPMTLYVRFRGHEPKVDALLRNRGLDPVKDPVKIDLSNIGGK